jgi:hypothetical protein
LIWSGSPSASAAPSRCRPTGWSLLVSSTSGPRGQHLRRWPDAATALPRERPQGSRDPR